MSIKRPNKSRPRKTDRVGSLEIIQYLVHEQGLSHPDAHGIWHGVLDYLRTTLVDEGTIGLQGLGVLDVYTITPRSYIHPVTGKRETSKPRLNVGITPSSVVLKDLGNTDG
jgi:nucleoid DNA-binding protein